jgi:hypothetical protein
MGLFMHQLTLNIFVDYYKLQYFDLSESHKHSSLLYHMGLVGCLPMPFVEDFVKS